MNDLMLVWDFDLGNEVGVWEGLEWVGNGKAFLLGIT
jgi:hypothetical protein